MAVKTKKRAAKAGGGKVKPLIGIVMGSKSDWPVMKESVAVLEKFGLPYEVRVISAHRSPEEATAFASTASTRGLKVIISAAGMAAHLGGVLAAHTHLPVIGVPMKGGALDGLDSLLSTVQMPRGVPVATVAMGGSGAHNAALLAVQMLALANENLKKKFQQYKRTMKQDVFNADLALQKELQED
jgi:5-(carboxyamino)imidazole ribonucleotide mutase